MYNQFKDQYLTQDYNREKKTIKTKNTIYQISTLEDQKNNTEPNVSSIDLGVCEQKLKKKYNISEKESLIIIKTDIKNNELSSTYVQYEIFHPYTLAKLEMDCCKEDKITVNSPVNLDAETISLYNSLNESGYNLFDSNDPYYNDVCSIYTTENGTDIAIFDRQKELSNLNKNISICQIGCTLLSYNITTQMAKCNCDVQDNSTEIDFTKIIFDRNQIMTSFLVAIKNSNFMVLKCYKNAFDISNLYRNIGRIIMSIILLAYLILLFIYIIKDRKNLDVFLNSILIYKSNRMKSKSKHVITEIKSKPKKEKNKKNKNKVKNIDKKKNKNKKKDKISKSNKNKGKNNEPPKKNFKSKINKNQIENLSKSNNNINDISEGGLMNKNKNKDLKNININIIPINNINYNKIKKKNIKNNKKIKSKLNNNYNIKIFNAKPKNVLNKKNDILYMNLNTQELNELSYDLALIYDKRTYMQYYCSLLRKKQLFLFAFIPANDYNLLTLKISLFLLSFSLYFTMNGFFFSDNSMHRLYIGQGSFNFIYEIPKILYSLAISSVINTILKYLSLSEQNILTIKQEKNLKIANKKSKDVKSFILIKFIIFFIISTTFLIFFWYFISCFCGVYINTQIILIQDTIFSFLLSMIYPFGINLIPGIFRISALRA